MAWDGLSNRPPPAPDQLPRVGAIRGLDLEENARDIVLRFGCFSVKEGIEESQTFKLVPEKPILKASDTAKLDYVLLQVEERISTARGIAPAPYEPQPPIARTGLSILQHPKGQVMQVAISSEAVTGVYKESGLIQYVNKTLVGSSGSPCFNDSWKVVALHHAQRSTSFGGIREGILFGAIYPEIETFLMG